MKMIIPIASPATVNVSQVEAEPINGKTNNASSGTSINGFQSKSSRFKACFIWPIPAVSVAVLHLRPRPASTPNARRARCP